MDRVLVDHLSTWQFVYDQLGISNDESFELYNQGLLDEWEWIKLDLALIKSAPGGNITDERLRNLMEGMPMMKGWHGLIDHLLEQGVHVAIVSGGLQKTARDIAASFPSDGPWRRRWGALTDTRPGRSAVVLILSFTCSPTDGWWSRGTGPHHRASEILVATRSK